jgi:hypothetical protein
MFAPEDEIANPSLGFAAPPRRYPWQPHARGLVAHLVYGVVTEMLLQTMTAQPRRSR